MVARGATSAYRGPVAFCPLAPLLPFASHSPAGCRVACCRVPPPRVTFRRAAASRVQTMATARRAVAIIVDFVVRRAVAIVVDIVVRRANPSNILFLFNPTVTPCPIYKSCTVHC